MEQPHVIILPPIIRTMIFNPENNIFEQSFNSQKPTITPLCKEFKQTLEEHTVDEHDLENELSCAICQESFLLNEKIIKLPCDGTSHFFHKGKKEEICNGIFPWFEEHNTCPVCRENFPEEKVNEDISVEEDYSEDIPVPNGNFDTENNDNDLNEEEENNLISEFLSGITNIDEGGEEEDVENPETMIENFINQLMGSTENQQDIRIIPSNPLIQILNNVQQEMNEDYQLQQAIQRSITER